MRKEWAFILRRNDDDRQPELQNALKEQLTCNMPVMFLYE
jgi:hypothetical protein